MVTMKGSEEGFGPIVMKLHRNVFGMCSCEFRINIFQNSHSSHGNHESKHFFNPIVMKLHWNYPWDVQMCIQD